MKRKNLFYEKTRIYKLLQKAFDKNFQSNQKKNGTAENARFSGDFCTEFFTDAKPAEAKLKGNDRDNACGGRRHTEAVIGNRKPDGKRVNKSCHPLYR